MINKILISLSILAVTLMPVTASANVLNSSNSNLGDLLILDQLFGGGNGGDIFGSDNDNNNLGKLFVLDRLFGSGGIGGGSNLGELFILDRLFNDNGGSLFDGSDSTTK